ncbi:MAG: SpoIIE family protein phosphatase [Candidatus Kapabacteria bacterium]|nr:SpoIIE family protein phosphatase [Candidatus Kapabacteria bacterium]
MGYLHYEMELEQRSKSKLGICGDVFYWERNPRETLMLLSDGLGHGIKANIAANLCIARLKELLHNGFSIRNAFAAVANTMDKAIEKGQPYAVFTIVRILPDGMTTVLSYEMPCPIFISRKISTILNQRQIKINRSTIAESTCVLSPNDAIVIMSDGITQAGIGHSLKNGWESEGLNKYINEYIWAKKNVFDLPRAISSEAHRLCENDEDDDATVAIAVCRPGSTVSIFTGPPANKAMDRKTVNRFMSHEGIKIVAGATTAKIVASALGKQLEIDTIQLDSDLTPPTSAIEGIDLVTEGALTLNQLYNVLDADRDDLIEENPVTEIYDYIMYADRVIFYMGRAVNKAHDISFMQLGMLSRENIVPLLADKLRKKGKLVLMEII